MIESPSVRASHEKAIKSYLEIGIGTTLQVSDMLNEIGITFGIFLAIIRELVALADGKFGSFEACSYRRPSRLSVIPRNWPKAG